MKRRVVITGLGAVTPLGNDVRSTWSAVLAGRSGVAPLTRFDAAGFPCRIGGELKKFDPAGFMSRKDLQRADPFIQYALAAALMASEDARLEIGGPSALRTGVVIGSGRGGAATTEKNMAAFLARGLKGVSPFFTPMSLVNMAPGFIAIRLKAKGPCFDVSTACASGTHALGEALNIIRRGDADVMLAGGSEAALTPLVLAGFCQARALSGRNHEPEKASRPFDLNRDGFVLAEGAGVLVLEEIAHAELRGARIYAEVAGCGLTSDGFHYTRPDPSGDGSARAMVLAMEDAGITPSGIDYINAHGTSTKPNDLMETAAIKKAFGDHAGRIPVSSSKSMLGHMLGASGAVEAAITALALLEGAVPPTINLEQPGPGCDLDYVPRHARRVPIRAALSNSLGFGGQNAALVLKSFV